MHFLKNGKLENIFQINCCVITPDLEEVTLFSPLFQIDQTL
jgi:hypothetical protein